MTIKLFTILALVSCSLFSFPQKDEVVGLYDQGEFQKAIDLLEDQRRKGLWKTKRDSVIGYKYLGVMYCANAATMELGRAYFGQLLRVEPQAKISELYVSYSIEKVFEQVREEIKTSFPQLFADSLKDSNNKPKTEMITEKSVPPPKEEQISSSGKSKKLWYTAAVVGTAAGAATLGYFLFATPESKTNTVSIRVD